MTFIFCESQVFNAVVEWVKFDVNSRQRLLNELIKNVRCHLIKPEFISRQLDIPQVIYVIEYVSKESKEKSLESEEFFLFETEVSYRLPKLCLPFGSRSSCAVINGFIYVLNKDDGGMDRLESG